MLLCKLIRPARTCSSLTWRKCSELRRCSQFVFQTLTRSCSDISLTPSGICQLKSRGLVQLKGSDAVPFLQGLITNDVTLLQQQTKSLYAMLLNVQGRTMYDMILYNITQRDGVPTLLLECDHSLLQDLITDIRKYKIRKKVSIDPASELAVYATLGQSDSISIPDDTEVVQQTKDPRVPSFGSRLIVKGDITGEDESLYHEYRVRWGIPEGPVDLPPGNCLPLECNLVYMNGVSFTKGCYLGQELTARTHHTGVIRKRIMPLVFPQIPDDIELGENILNQQNKSVGKFRNSIGKFGLGLMRIADLKGELNVKTKTGDRVQLTAIQPEWWPKE